VIVYMDLMVTPVAFLVGFLVGFLEAYGWVGLRAGLIASEVFDGRSSLIVL
jgi:hypothetical protein